MGERINTKIEHKTSIYHWYDGYVRGTKIIRERSLTDIDILEQNLQLFPFSEAGDGLYWEEYGIRLCSSAIMISIS